MQPLFAFINKEFEHFKLDRDETIEHRTGNDRGGETHVTESSDFR